MMTKLKPQEKPYEWVMVSDGDDPNRLFWVKNKNFSVHLNDMIVIKSKNSLGMVRVVKRTRVKPLKGEPIWRVVATNNQFPVAENEQVVACNHVAPAPNSVAMVSSYLDSVHLETQETFKVIQNRINTLKEMINNG